ncbi:MAG: molybdopterin molybdotransferase MoeA, partial [Novosphingobium sp.]
DGPWKIVGESAAGHPFTGHVNAGEAVRISTGAHVPAGTDAILLQENARRYEETLELNGEGHPTAHHIRRAGFDFVTGDTLASAGKLLDPVMVALAIAAGNPALSVRRRPRVTIIDSGDELATDPANCGPHQIPASNGPMLQAMLAALPCDVQRLGPVPDRLDALVDALECAADADLIVTSGGASVGDHDLVRPALEHWGADIVFWRVAMKPGKPLMVARRGQTLVLGLPGNPVSSYVTACLFLLPLVRKLAGAAAPLPTFREAPAGALLKPGGPRLEFVRGWWDGRTITPLPEQDSSALLSLSRANCLILRPAQAPVASIGTHVSFYQLENGSIA